MESHYRVALSSRIFCDDRNVSYLHSQNSSQLLHVSIEHLKCGMIEEPNFKFHLTLRNLIFNNHMWPGATFYWTVSLENGQREEHVGHPDGYSG